MSRNPELLFLIACEATAALSVLAQLVVLVVMAVAIRNGLRRLTATFNRAQEIANPLKQQAIELRDSLSFSFRTTRENIRICNTIGREVWTNLNHSVKQVKSLRALVILRRIRTCVSRASSTQNQNADAPSVSDEIVMPSSQHICTIQLPPDGRVGRDKIRMDCDGSGTPTAHRLVSMTGRPLQSPEVASAA
jgi:hypothetical protein